MKHVLGGITLSVSLLLSACVGGGGGQVPRGTQGDYLVRIPG